MGCDIHIILERKYEEGGPWIGYTRFRYFTPSMFGGDVSHKYGFFGYLIRQRNYEFFNDLAGVRGSGSGFGYEPRGLPGDASELVRAEFAEDDLHSHSWLTMAELRPVLTKHFAPQVVGAKLLDKRMPEDPINAFVDNDIGDTGELNEKFFRLVFAFDN